MIIDEYDIFISYRRKDTAGHARLIAKELEKTYRIFLDVDGIDGGDIFPSKLEDAIEKSKILLSIIGEDSCEEFEKRKGKIDYVVEEIAYAKKKTKVIIPVLIDGVDMPSKDCLPTKIAFLDKIDAKHIRHVSFDDSIAKLVKAIDKKLFFGELNIIKKFDNAENLLNIYPWKKILYEEVGQIKYQYWACGKEVDPNYYLIFFPSTRSPLRATRDFLTKIENKEIEKPKRPLTILRDTNIGPKIKSILNERNIKSFFYTYRDYYWAECIPDIQDYKNENVADEYYVDQYLYRYKNNDDSNLEKPIGKVSEVVMKYIKADSANPVLAILGQAGSGKTTFIDRVIERIDANPKLQCIFMSSETIKKKFENTKVLPQIKSIYNLYEYCEDTIKLDKEKFLMGIANGSISILIDGLEEIISLFNTQDKFNTDSFFDSLVSINSQLAKCKVIVTSREQSNKENNIFLRKEILVYRLQGFDDKMVDLYLEKRFPASMSVDRAVSQKHVKKVKSYLSSIAKRIVGKRVVPYILDIISESVEEEFGNADSEDLSFANHNEYLSNNEIIDMIVYSYFFTRELKRQSQLYPDNFTPKDLAYIVIDLVISAGSVFSERKILETVSYKYSEKSRDIVEAMKKSPLFICGDDGTFRLKYDFLYNYFVCLFLIQEFGGVDTSNYPYKALSRLQNEIIDDFVQYFRSDREDIFMKNANRLITDIVKEIKENPSRKGFFESAVYNIMILSIKVKSETLSAEKNMDVIKEIFSTKQTKKIEHLYILGDFYPLDFSNIEVWNSKFVEYGNFFKSKFDNSTFLYSVFENMRNTYRREATDENIWKKITFDETCELGDIKFIFSYEDARLNAKKRVQSIMDLVSQHRYIFKLKDTKILRCLEEYGFIRNNNGRIDLLRQGKQFKNNGTMNKKVRGMIECILDS